MKSRSYRSDNSVVGNIAGNEKSSDVLFVFSDIGATCRNRFRSDEGQTEVSECQTGCLRDDIVRSCLREV